jgi:hypothetical protein
MAINIRIEITLDTSEFVLSHVCGVAVIIHPKKYGVASFFTNESPVDKKKFNLRIRLRMYLCHNSLLIGKKNSLVHM